MRSPLAEVRGPRCPPGESSTENRSRHRLTACSGGGSGSSPAWKVGPIRRGESPRLAGHAAIDPESHKIELLEAVDVDTATDKPCLITVKMGMTTRHRMVFVPVTGATISPIE
jgi:hypothetical protein